MKKISIFLLSIIICFSFIGCNSENKSANASDVTESAVTSSTVTDSEESTTDLIEKEESSEKSSTSNSKETSTDKETTKSVNSYSTYKNTTKVTDSKTTSKKATEKTTNGRESQKATTKNESKKTTTNKTNDKKTTSKHTTATQETTKSYVTCYVTVECTAILHNMDKLKEGHEKYVPDNGEIITKKKLKVKNGSTAFDVIKLICDKEDIKLSTSGSGKSVYIKGFNNIDEFDCGGGSGWTYYVNNTFPPKSCGAYTLSDGDVIRFSYVC